MVSTRSVRKGPRPQGDAEETEFEVDNSARRGPESSGSDEEDAPEEFTLSTGKEVRGPAASWPSSVPIYPKHASLRFCAHSHL
jgi:hypothetical protein